MATQIWINYSNSIPFQYQRVHEMYEHQPLADSSFELLLESSDSVLSVLALLVKITVASDTSGDYKINIISNFMIGH